MNSVYATPANAVNTPGKSSNRSQSVWVRADKGDKLTPTKGAQSKVNRKVLKRASQISTASSSDSPDSNRNSVENPIELNEQACIVVLVFGC